MVAFDNIPILRWLLTRYEPDETARDFMQRVQTQTQNGIEVSLTVLDSHESRRFFGIRMARRGMQPVWLRITNNSAASCRLHVISIDPNYYSPHEAAAANHFSTGKRILGFGLLAWTVFLPILWLLPLKVITAWLGNRRMDAFFLKHGFRLRPVAPANSADGFVFTQLDIGNKVVHVRLLSGDAETEFVFNVPVAGLAADYLHRDFQDLYAPDQLIECDLPALWQKLIDMPKATTNGGATRNGDPVNLVVVGEFPALISAFGARWDETESITLATSWKTFRAFLVGAEYRYSPVSPLYLFGRSQDFALQRIRQSINERLHLRLWTTPLRLNGAPVWVGQISRDIGVRFTFRTWNLTTHRIDPDVDEARDYVVEDLLEAERLELAAYVGGVEACTVDAARKNLTGDKYFTDGQRAIVVVATTRTKARFATHD
jgi:hypothetical protein